MATTQPTPQGTGGNILGAAFTQYGQGTGSYNTTPASQVKNPTAQYEYGIPTNNPATTRSRLGKDTDGDGYREVDCSTLVFNGLRNAGYQIPGAVANSEAVPFSTQTLFNKDGLTEVAKQSFDSIEKADLKPGDIILFRPTAAGNAQHIGIYYGTDAAGRMMFYGSQSSSGPDIATVITANPALDTKANYWGGSGAIFAGALRPKPELYVPEMDLTGGLGTGLSSDKVIAAVNLLKSSNVEGYHPNIYSNNPSGNGDGVPTVGNGLALVVKGSNGWIVRPENDIKDMLRDAGLPESKYNELPLDKLTQSAGLLNQGRLAEARALFGTGDADGFSITPAEADKVSASFVIRNVIPSMVKSFGDAENFSFLEPGEFAAAASKVYQSPGWLQSTQGKNFLDAWWRDDTDAAQAALGTGIRGNAEASAYAGNISLANESLGRDGTGDSQATPAGGHWDDRTIYDLHTGNDIEGENKVWVPDKPVTPLASYAATGTTNTPSSPSPSASATIQLSQDGKSATLPNGQVISAGTGGLLDMDAGGNLRVSLLIDRALMKFKFVFLSLFLAATAQAETPVKAATPMAESKAVVRPAMPDGLYMGNLINMLPFLLVEKGKWIDPYEWVERNSLDELNRQYVQGQKFESFNVHTWLNTVEDMTLYAKSPQLLLANGQIKNGIKAQVNALAPSITTDQCDAGGANVWRCKPVYKVPKSLPRDSCRDDANSRGCGVSIIAPKSAYQKLAASSSDPGVLNVDKSSISGQIESAYKSLFPSNTAQPRIETNAYPRGIFYGPDKQKLIAGSMELGYRTNLKWKPSYSGEVGPARWVRLGFVWDIDRARFAYLQETAKVLNKTSDSKCAAGKLQRYCTTTSQIGMWANEGKLYTVWLHSQVVATYIPMRLDKTPDDAKLLSSKQFEIVEVDLKRATSTSIFETKSFLGLN